MNIAFFTQGSSFNGDTLSEKGLGGSESALAYIAKALATLGNRVTVFNNCDFPGHYSGVEYKHFSEIVSYSKNNPLDVCVLSRFYEPAARVNARARILWLHDVAQTPYYRDAFPILNKYIDRYFFIGKWQQSGYLRLHEIPPEKIYLTRNGIDPELFRQKTKRSNNKLIYINTPYRGLDVLLKMFPAIRQSRPDVELYLYTGMSLYGDSFSDWEEELKPLYQYAEQIPGVHMCEPVPKQTLARELMSSRLSLYPSHFEECCSVASLETQAAGTPMITTRLGGLQDTIIDGETGVLIPANDPNSLSHSPEYQKKFISRTLSLLTNEAAWRKLSDGARNHAVNCYSWESISREWNSLFHSLTLAQDG
jgi:glycosyltransferase involved in cell wall biosynthesis